MFKKHVRQTLFPFFFNRCNIVLCFLRCLKSIYPLIPTFREHFSSLRREKQSEEPKRLNINFLDKEYEKHFIWYIAKFKVNYLLRDSIPPVFFHVHPHYSPRDLYTRKVQPPRGVGTRSTRVRIDKTSPQHTQLLFALTLRRNIRRDMIVYMFSLYLLLELI